MTATYFVDTNIFLYAGSAEATDAPKRERAIAILRKPGMGLSAQVMQEYYSVAFRKGRLGITCEEALRSLHAMSKYPVVPVTSALVIDAVAISERYRISYWDAAIVAAAHVLECEVIYSEDLQHGQAYGAVRIVNPFMD